MIDSAIQHTHTHFVYLVYSTSNCIQLPPIYRYLPACLPCVSAYSAYKKG